MHIVAFIITALVIIWAISIPWYFFHRKDLKRYLEEMKANREAQKELKKKMRDY